MRVKRRVYDRGTIYSLGDLTKGRKKRETGGARKGELKEDRTKKCLKSLLEKFGIKGNARWEEERVV